MKKILILLLLFVALTASAQTDTTDLQTDSVEVQIIVLPASTAIGARDGKSVSKEIGPAGGKIVSDDGRVELNFTEGALSVNTTISIQPIVNLIPNGTGKAYQFEPSGIKFQKPVQLIFHYSDEEAESCPPELKFMAIQDHNGKWEYMDYDDWDSTTNSLKGFITHFSAFVNGNLAELCPRAQTLKINSSREFNLCIVKTSDNAPTPGDADGEDDLPPLPVIAPLGNWEAEWLVNEKVGGTAQFGTIIP